MVYIRRAAPADAVGICELHRSSIRRLCSASYSPEQIASWTEALQPDRYLPAMERFEFFVAEAGGVVGFCIVDPNGGELNALYVAPRSSGEGVGSALLEYAERVAIAHSVARLRVKSTVNAVTFYESHGFRQVRRALHVNPAGLELECVEMVKDLPRGSRVADAEMESQSD